MSRTQTSSVEVSLQPQCGKEEQRSEPILTAEESSATGCVREFSLLTSGGRGVLASAGTSSSKLDSVSLECLDGSSSTYAHSLPSMFTCRCNSAAHGGLRLCRALPDAPST